MHTPSSSVGQVVFMPGWPPYTCMVPFKHNITRPSSLFAYIYYLLKIYIKGPLYTVTGQTDNRINGVLPSALSRFSANSNSFLLSAVRLRLSIVFRKHCSAFAWQVRFLRRKITDKYGKRTVPLGPSSCTDHRMSLGTRLKLPRHQEVQRSCS